MKYAYHVIRMINSTTKLIIYKGNIDNSGYPAIGFMNNKLNMISAMMSLQAMNGLAKLQIP